MEQTSVTQEILDAFHLMWDLHPGPVMLVRANREIVAVNATGKELGIPEGSKCFTLAGRNSLCKNCKGNAALADGTAKRSGTYSESYGGFVDGYWTPLVGVPGLFLHYANNISEYVRPELLVPAAD
ncbi:hypothetical protein [Desulfovibrio sp. TomC]|uniref:hypothetical protein n=1 Tax=Desulfovibrio sp. TomC TaxID=1562888 RepID=UPI00057418FC|nr:hypothetical protein [Desulfovibrio sp. TomC]KHK01035.1 hypothetical protein NY78_3576 [Desulfovibrio sp. TomC]